VIGLATGEDIPAFPPIRSTVPPVMPPLPLAVRLPAIVKNKGASLKFNPVDENTYVPFRLLAPKPLVECSPGVDELLLPPQATRNVSPKSVRSRTNPWRAKSAEAFLPTNVISWNRAHRQ
jgi:hypothetical protein